MRRMGTTLVAVGILLVFQPETRASLNSPVVFSQAGTVVLRLDESFGGFDHILELTDSIGPVHTPLMALTDTSDPSDDVIGYAPASVGDTVVLGSFAEGQEIPFRLTLFGSERLGTPGLLGNQIFTGTSSSVNPVPEDYYSYVDFINPTTIKVYMEDLFGVPIDDPDPVNTLLTSGYEVAFTLTLVPEPGTLALALSAVTAFFWRRR